MGHPGMPGMRLYRGQGVDEVGEERGTAGHLAGEDELVRGVGVVSDRAQAIQGWNSERGSEVAVGATADGGFGEREAELGGGVVGKTIEAHGFLGALEGRPLDASVE